LPDAGVWQRPHISADHERIRARAELLTVVLDEMVYVLGDDPEDEDPKEYNGDTREPDTRRTWDEESLFSYGTNCAGDLCW
jgi:hypothetical protein